MANTLLITKQSGGYFKFDLSVDGVAQEPVRNMRNDAFGVGNICHFKTATGANIVQKQNITVFDVTLVAGGTFTFTDIDVFLNKLIDVGYWDWMNDGSGGGGADRFDALEDTFEYFGRNGQVVVVNESELKLETIVFNNVANIVDLEDTFDELIADKMLVVNSTGDKVILKTQPTPPAEYLNSIGFFVYDDQATRTTPLSFLSGVEKKLTNDALGDFTNLAYPPYGVSRLWNSTTNQIDFTQCGLGDIITLRLAIEPTTTVENQNWEIILKLGIGSAEPLDMVIFNHNTKPAGLEPQTFDIEFGIGSENIKDFPAELYILSDGNGTITTGVFYFSLLRKNINIIDVDVDVSEKLDRDGYGGTGKILDERISILEDIQNLQSNFTGVFDLSKKSSVYYSDYTSGPVVNLSLSATKVLGSVGTVRIKGDLLGSIPTDWRMSGQVLSVLPTQLNELTILYVNNDDIRIVNRVVTYTDTVAPSVPLNLIEINITGTTVSLSWDASTDNIGVSSYKIRQGGIVVANPVTTSTTITGLSPETLYSFTVSAMDDAGNESSQSEPLEVTTNMAIADPITILPNLNSWIDGTDAAQMSLNGSNGVLSITDKKNASVLNSNLTAPLFDTDNISFAGTGLLYKATANSILKPSTDFHGFFIFKDKGDGRVYDLITNRVDADNRFTLAIKSGSITVGTYNGSSFNCKSTAFSDTSSYHKLEFKNISGVVTAYLDDVLMTGTVSGTTGIVAGLLIAGTEINNASATKSYHFKDFILNSGEMTSGERTGILNYISTKYGL